MTYQILQGDALTVLKGMATDSVDCCVTSPPYYGLRDYGTAEWSGGLPDCGHTYNHGALGSTGQRADRAFTAQAVYKDVCRKCGAVRIDEQIGLEANYPEFIAKLVAVFAEVRRVLKPEGTLWMNLGDSYATGAGAVGKCPGGGEQGEKWAGYRGTRPESQKHSSGAMRLAGDSDQDPKRAAPRGPMTQANRMPQPGLKPKDLMMIPARVAIALQDDGWYLRSDVIWHKPNPMPESVTDRPTKSHEYLFLLAKSEKYFYNADAIKEPIPRVSCSVWAWSKR